MKRARIEIRCEKWQKEALKQHAKPESLSSWVLETCFERVIAEFVSSKNNKSDNGHQLGENNA